MFAQVRATPPCPDPVPHPRCVLRSPRMLARLPGWVVDDATSIREEVAELVGTTPEERWRLCRLCARDAMWAVRANRDPARVLDHQDPLPPDTIAALARLQERTGRADR